MYRRLHLRFPAGMLVMLLALLLASCGTRAPATTTVSWQKLPSDLTWTSTPRTTTASTSRWPTGSVPLSSRRNHPQGNRLFRLHVSRLQESVSPQTETQLRRTAHQNCRKVAKRNLKEGDLVFFHNGRKKRKATHVGIYLKDGRFVHASTSRGVIVSRLEEDYYRRCWMQGGRVKGI